MRLVRQLSALHEREYVLPTANGTVALYLVLRALGLRGINVAIPNSVCPNVPMAILYSGNYPVFVDIEHSTLSFSASTLRHCPERMDAVVAVHAYGAMCQIDGIVRYCERSGIPLIEDFALAQGGQFKGRPVGSFGIASIVSFGAGKTVSCGHGGAILTDDPMLFADIRSMNARLPMSSPIHRQAIHTFMSEFRTDYNRWLDVDLNGFWRKFKERTLRARVHFLCRLNPRWTDHISQALEQLKQLVTARRRKAEHLHRLLTRSDPRRINVVVPPAGSVPWRFNLLVTHGRNALLKSLLAQGYKVSSWQMPTDLLFQSRHDRKGDLKTSDLVGDQILNIWVNEEVGMKYLKAVSDALAKFFDRREASQP